MQARLFVVVVVCMPIYLTASGKQFLMNDLSLMKQFNQISESEEAAYKWLFLQTHLLEKVRQNQELQRQRQQEKYAQIVRKYLGNMGRHSSILKDLINRY